jgi:hypothetical protein
MNLDIRQRNGRFEATLSSDTRRNPHQLRFDLSTDDLSDIIKELVDDLVCAVRAIGSKLRLTDEDRLSARKEFQRVAEDGNAALKDIFYPEDLRLFEELASGASKVILNVVSKDFAFPWELLYSDYQRDCLEYENFWGFKYIIYRNIPPRPGQDVPNPEIKITPVPVGLLADRALPAVARAEVPFLIELEKKQLIRLLTLPRELDAGRRDELIDTDLKRFFEQELQIVHFACHTRAPFSAMREPQNEYCLLLSEDFPLWPRDFKLSTLAFGNHPLVVLNACGTSPRDPRRTRNMVQALFRYGARGVVATECIVPDTFAAAFTRRFYPLLLDGQELGDALFGTRRSLLKAPYHNPLGLLYALYAFPHTRFIPMN